MANDLNLLVRAELDKRQTIQSFNRLLEELAQSQSLKKLQVRLEFGQAQLLALVTDQTRVLYSAFAGLSGELSGTLVQMAEVGIAMSAANDRIVEVAESVQTLVGQWRALAAASGQAKEATTQAAPDTKPLVEWQRITNQVFNDAGQNKEVTKIAIEKLERLGGVFSFLGSSAASARLATLAFGSVLTFGVTVAVTAAIGGLFQLIEMIGASDRKLQAYMQTLGKQIGEEQKRIEQLTELRGQYDAANQSFMELQATQQSISDLMPEAISHYDEHGNAVYKSKVEIDKLIASEQKLLELRKLVLNNGLTLSLKDTAKEMEQAREQVDEQTEKLKEAELKVRALDFARDYALQTGYTSELRGTPVFNDPFAQVKREVERMFSESGVKIDSGFITNLYLTNDLDEASEYFRVQLAKIQGDLLEAQDQLQQGSKQFLDSFRMITEGYLTGAELDDPNLSLFLDRFAESFVNAKEITSRNYEEMSGLFRSHALKLTETLRANKVDLAELVETGRMSELEAVLKKSGMPAEIAAMAYESFGKSLAGASKESERMAEANLMLESNLNQLVQRTNGDLLMLDQTLSQVRQGQGLSAETIMKLTQQFPQLQAEVRSTSNGLYLHQDALAAVRKEIVDKANKELENEAKATATTLENTLKRLEIYGIEIGAIHDLASSKSLLAQLDAKKKPTIPDWIPGAGAEAYREEAGQYNETIDRLKASITEASERMEYYKKLLASSSGSRGGSGAAKTAVYTPPKITEPPYEPGIRFSRLEEEIKHYNRLLEDNRGRIEDAIARGKPYSNLLENRIRLYQELAGSMKQLEQVQLKEQQELAGKLVKLGLVDGAGQVLDGLSERLLELSKGKEKSRMGLSMDAIEQMVTDFTALKDKVAQTKQELNGLVTEIARAMEGALERIQDAGTGKRDAIRRKISLMGEINTEEELTALAGYTERIMASLRSDSALIWSEVVRLRGIVNDASATAEMKKAAELAMVAYGEEANQLHVELIEASEELGKQQAESIVKGFDKQLEDAEFELSLLGDSEADQRKAELVQEQLRRTMVAAREQLHAQLVELERKLGTELDAAERMRAQTKLEALQRYDRQVAKSLADRAKQEQSRQQEALKAREAAAEEIIASYKKMLEKQRQLQLDAIKAERESENKRYTERMQHLDDEMGKFEASIQLQLQSFDRLSEAEDNEAALAKLLKERAEIESRLDVLALDDSWESKAKQKELREQLEQKQEEIGRFQLERERAERKQALQDQLDDRKKTIDEAKRLEAKFHEAQLSALEQRQQAIERSFEEQLGDERHFYEMKQQLLSDDASKVQTQLTTIRGSYETFFQQVLSSSQLYGSQIADNILYAFQQDLQPVAAYEASHGTEDGAGSAKTAEAWKLYLANKQEAETKGASAERLKQLKAENDKLRAQFKFRDGSFAELSKLPGPVFTAETGGVTPSFAGGKFLLAHEKEMVLNKRDTQHVLEAIEISRQLTTPLRQSVAAMVPAATAATAAAASAKSALGTVIERLYIDVSGKFAQPNGEDVGASIIQSLRRKGITFA